MSHEEALEVLRVSTTEGCTGWKVAGASLASDLYEVQRSAKKIITFCSDLDKILGGGVPIGHVTEFCGVPGVGKTQIGMQLAVDVQIPAAFGGVGGAAVYVDTEGSFVIERVTAIAAAAVQHIHHIAARPGKQELLAHAQAFTVEHILSNILYFRIHDYAEQVALVNMLDQFLEVHSQVKLIVVDSVAFHFRQDFKDMAHRTRVLTQMAQDLMRVCEQRQLAVVLMNQVTTRFMEDQTSKLVPALGDSWGHAATTRVILYWQEAERFAFVFKSPCMPQATAAYRVTQSGVRGMRPADSKRGPDAAGLQAQHNDASRPRRLDS
ncbi:MAG: hypothetical protein WDW38_003392 [Sanguina aurantia]